MRAIRPSFRTRSAAVLVAAGFALALAGCANDPLAEQYRAGENTGFIANEFAVQEIPIDQRGEPVEFAATTENGDPVSSDDFAGDVLVVNFWYAACGPCRAEADDLETAYGAFAGEDVSFLGVNTLDSPEAAARVRRDVRRHLPERHRVARRPRSSSPSPRRRRSRPPPPPSCSTREGRVAARIIGQLPGSSILETLVRDTLAESSPEGTP